MANQELPAAKINRIHRGDCVAGMKKLPAGCVDLAFADPPFNIGYEYDVYDDRKGATNTLSGPRNGSRPSIVC